MRSRASVWDHSILILTAATVIISLAVVVVVRATPPPCYHFEIKDCTQTSFTCGLEVQPRACGACGDRTNILAESITDKCDTHYSEAASKNCVPDTEQPERLCWTTYKCTDSGQNCPDVLVPQCVGDDLSADPHQTYPNKLTGGTCP